MGTSRGNPLEKYWVSSSIGTGQVDVRGGVIVDVPRIWWKFKGQRLENLVGWLRQWPGEVVVDRMVG